ncbi:hypothetical protein Tco_1010956 [Tanacetum coccineum]
MRNWESSRIEHATHSLDFYDAIDRHNYNNERKEDTAAVADTAELQFGERHLCAEVFNLIDVIQWQRESESNGGLDGNVLKSEVELLGASAERLRSDGKDSEKEISTQSEGEYRLGAIGSNSDPYWKI